MIVKTISILGSTGSIGCSTLEVIDEVNNSSDEINFDVVAICANKDSKKLIEQAKKFNPKLVAVCDINAAKDVKEALANTDIEVVGGKDASIICAQVESDMVMASIVGFAGLAPTIEAIKRSATILLANKECLVSAGSYFMSLAHKYNSQILPVDSEHNAIFQVLTHEKSVDKLILTASGGPFRNFSYEELKKVTPAQACKHPNWDMGQKISVDSASMMNKGLELIEASHLFNMPEDRIDVLIHPQSIVHSLVAYTDGSFLAQLGEPDMRIPISYCMMWPNRAKINTPRLDLAKALNLEFFNPDMDKFRSLFLAREALKMSKAAPTLLNASNEVAVSCFLKGEISFIDIPIVVEEVLNNSSKVGKLEINSLDDAIYLDNIGRREAAAIIKKITTGVVS